LLPPPASVPFRPGLKPAGRNKTALIVRYCLVHSDGRVSGICAEKNAIYFIVPWFSKEQRKFTLHNVTVCANQNSLNLTAANLFLFHLTVTRVPRVLWGCGEQQCVRSKALWETVNTRQRLNLLTPNDDYSGRTATLTSKCCILYIYSTNIDTEYFKHGIGLYSPFFPLQNAVCFIILTYLVPVLFTFYIQGVLKLKINSGA